MSSQKSSQLAFHFHHGKLKKALQGEVFHHLPGLKFMTISSVLTMVNDNEQVLDRTRSLKKGVMAASLDVSFCLLMMLSSSVYIKCNSESRPQMYVPHRKFGHMFTASHDSEELSFLRQKFNRKFFKELLEKSRTKLGYETDRQVG